MSIFSFFSSRSDFRFIYLIFLSLVMPLFDSLTELCVNTIRWHLNGSGKGVDIPFDNVPFCWVGRKYLVCQFGKRKTGIKEKVSKV